jgi:hypothetical protein
MASLTVFPDPPPLGTYTKCERNAELLTAPADTHRLDQVLNLLTGQLCSNFKLCFA